MQRLTDLLQFYSICYRIVKGWPATFENAGAQETRHKRINTFGVIRNLSDFDTDNLQKTVQYTSKDFFFSRVWHDSQYQPDALRVEYPTLGIREETFQLTEPLDIASGRRRTTHSLILMLADQIPVIESVTGDPFSSARTIEEIGNDLREKMAQLLLTLGRFIYAETQKAGVPVFEGWYDKNHLEDLKADGTLIDNYIEVDNLLSYITAVAPAQGEVFYEPGSDNLVVCILPLTVETSSCPATLPEIVYDDPVDPSEKSAIFEGEFQAG